MTQRERCGPRAVAFLDLIDNHKRLMSKHANDRPFGNPKPEVTHAKIARFKLNDRILSGALNGDQLRVLEGGLPDLERGAGVNHVALSVVKLKLPTMPLKVIAVGRVRTPLCRAGGGLRAPHPVI